MSGGRLSPQTPVPSQHGRLRAFVRFAAVSGGVVPAVQIAILVLQIAGLKGWVANFVAVALLTGPAYALSRRFVWPARTTQGLRPATVFWILSLGGLVLSSGAIFLVERHVQSIFVANAINLATYGMIFVLRFVWLDRLFSRSSKAA